MHRGKVDPGASELSRDHVNRPLDWVIFVLLFLAKIALYLCTINAYLDRVIFGHTLSWENPTVPCVPLTLTLTG